MSRDLVDPAGPAGERLRRHTRRIPSRPPKLVFAFPGIGGEYRGIGAALAQRSPVYAQALDRVIGAAAATGVEIGAMFEPVAPAGPRVDLRRMVRDGATAGEAAGGTGADQQLSLAQRHLSLFAVQIALVDLLRHAAVEPAAVVGHSLGEWTAATVAGVLALRNAVGLIARRAELIEAAPPGSTIAVAAGSDVVRPLLSGGMTIAADNASASCTVSGPVEDSAEVEARLAEAGLVHRRLVSQLAFHNSQLAAAATDLGETAEKVPHEDPALDLVSTVTGDWVEQATIGADHWATQLTAPVAFRRALLTLADRYHTVVEIGPGSIRAWASQTVPDLEVVRTMRSGYEGVDDLDIWQQALASLWIGGHDPRWSIGPTRRSPFGATPPSLVRAVYDPTSSDRPSAQAVAAPLLPDGEPLTDPISSELGALRHEMADLWCVLLGESEIGDDDHFFDLGGDSLLGRQLIAMLQARTGREVPGEVIFAGGSLREMVASVHEWLTRGHQP